MSSVERTAYPPFSRSLTAQELSHFFTPPEEEITVARELKTRGEPPDFEIGPCPLRLHGMGHTIVNGAALTALASGEAI
jgi:hypothetical protein